MDMTNFAVINGRPDGTTAKEYALSLIRHSRYPRSGVLPGYAEETLKATIGEIDKFITGVNSSGCTWMEFVAGCSLVARKNRETISYVLEQCEYRNMSFMNYFVEGTEITASFADNDADGLVSLAITTESTVERLKEVFTDPQVEGISQQITEAEAMLTACTDPVLVPVIEDTVTKLYVSRVHVRQHFRLATLMSEYTNAAAALLQVVDHG